MAGHDVVALVRDASRAQLPSNVSTVIGDARSIENVARTMNGTGAAVFCINPPFATWLMMFRPLLDCAITAARQTGTRLAGSRQCLGLRPRLCRGLHRLFALAFTDVSTRQAAQRNGTRARCRGHPLRDRSSARVLRSRGRVADRTCVSCGARQSSRTVAWSARCHHGARLYSRRRASPCRRRNRHKRRECHIPSVGTRAPHRSRSRGWFTRPLAASRERWSCRHGYCPPLACSVQRHGAPPTSAICGQARSSSTAPNIRGTSAPYPGRHSLTQSQRPWRGTAPTLIYACRRNPISRSSLSKRASCPRIAWINAIERCRRTLLLRAEMSACGIDFGTSNTTFGRIVNRAPVLVPLETDQTTIPSAIFFERDGGVLIGKESSRGIRRGVARAADAQPEVCPRHLPH